MTPSDQAQVQKMISQAIMKNNQQARFNLNVNPRQTHSGIDSPQINQAQVASKVRAMGYFTISQLGSYKVGTTFNPVSLFVQGNVTGPNGEKFMIVGMAQLGPSFYLQGQSITSVQQGGTPQNVVQSCTYGGVDSNGGFHTLVSIEHIVNIEYGGTTYARTTVGQWVEQANTTFVNQPPQFDSTGIYLSTDILVSGWNINLSCTVS